MKQEQKPNPAWNSLHREAAEWFRDAKFGMFFHWGPYCVPAFENEWYSRNMYAKGLSQNRHHEETYGKLSEFGYKDFIPMFKGEKFDADAWADLVVRTGAKYAGPVTEHADNFALWDSKVNPVNAVAMGPKRDVVGECAEAFRKRNIKFLATFHHQWLWGWFMSSDPNADVYDPENEIYYGQALPLETNRYTPYRWPNEKFNIQWRDKVLEVVDKYQPDVMYFDSRTYLIDEPYKIDITKAFYDTGKDKVLTYKQEDFPADVGVYDIECGRFSDIAPYPWQADDRLEDKITWSIVQKPKYKSALRVIHLLCDIVSKNGNLLLNVGPNADGTFPEQAVEILYEVGDWLAINGEAIYSTRPFTTYGEGPTVVESESYDVERIEAQTEEGRASDTSQHLFTYEDVRFTTKGDTLYAICFGRPPSGKQLIKTLSTAEPKKVENVSLVGGEALSFTQTEQGLTIDFPSNAPEQLAYSYRIE